MLAPDDPRHGTMNGYANTMNGYANLDCRCDGCRSAWADYHRSWARRSGRPSWESRHRDSHGIISRYNMLAEA